MNSGAPSSSTCSAPSSAAASASRELIKAGGGSVVNTTSNVALMGFPGRDSYTAAKGGVSAITRSLAVAYAPQKVRVNAIAPATTRTERALKMMGGDETVARITQSQLLGIGEPIDIAHAALYLASDEIPHDDGLDPDGRQRHDDFLSPAFRAGDLRAGHTDPPPTISRRKPE